MRTGDRKRDFYSNALLPNPYRNPYEFRARSSGRRSEPSPPHLLHQIVEGHELPFPLGHFELLAVPHQPDDLGNDYLGFIEFQNIGDSLNALYVAVMVRPRMFILALKPRFLVSR